MPSLALIFCTLEQAGKSAGKLPESIDSRSVELAIEWCTFLETHAKRAYGEVLEPGKAAARHLLAKIHKKAVRDFDRPRDLYRKRWKGLGTAEDFEAAISTLAEYGWLRVETLNSDGRNTEVIRLHPSLRAG
jgi:hypothetical protein